MSIKKKASSLKSTSTAVNTPPHHPGAVYYSLDQTKEREHFDNKSAGLWDSYVKSSLSKVRKNSA